MWWILSFCVVSLAFHFMLLYHNKLVANTRRRAIDYWYNQYQVGSEYLAAKREEWFRSHQMIDSEKHSALLKELNFCDEYKKLDSYERMLFDFSKWSYDDLMNGYEKKIEARLWAFKRKVDSCV